MSLSKKQIFFFIFLAPLVALSQKQDKNTTLEKVKAYDSLFWNGYNNCNMQQMVPLLDTKIEFYHDKGGITLGADALIASIKKYICENKEGKIRRAVIKTTEQYHLLYNGDALYGVLFTGDHLFYITPKEEKEKLTGTAKYSTLWLLQNNTWKMARVLSYAHEPVMKAKE